MVSLPAISYLDDHIFSPDGHPVVAIIDVLASNTDDMLQLVTL